MPDGHTTTNKILSSAYMMLSTKILNDVLLLSTLFQCYDFKSVLSRFQQSFVDPASFIIDNRSMGQSKTKANPLDPL